jgi:transcriptional regulator with XRE-family HTH domain
MGMELKLEMIRQRKRNFDLAKYLSCDPAKVSRILNGWLVPDEATKTRIAKFLEMPVDNLFSGRPKEEADHEE